MNTITQIIPQPNGRNSHIKVDLSFITPTIAREMINKTAEHQRDVKSFSTYKLQNDMEEARWYFTGAPIVFDQNKELIDGQHRLRSLIESGCKGQWLLVVSGVQRDAFIAFDSGVRKSTADFFRFEEIKNANFAAATANWLVRYEAIKDGKLLHSSLVSKSMVEKAYHERSEAIQNAHGKNIPLGRFVGSSSAVGALHIIISEAYGEEFCNRFMNGLSSGMGPGLAGKLHASIDRDNKARRKHITPDDRFVSILEAARSAMEKTNRKSIKPSVQAATKL
jgi:hypothetical protein